MKNERENTIFLMGFYGRRSFGDDLMVLGVINRLLLNSSLTLMVAVEDPSFLSPLVSDRVIIVKRRIFSILSSMRMADAFIQAGGTIFHDSYKGADRIRYLRNLSLWAFLFIFSVLCCRRTVALGVGVGPLSFSLSRLITRLALSCCDSIAVRDQSSLNVVRSLFPNSQISIMPDLAFLYDVASLEPVETGAVIGLSPCALSPFTDNEALDNIYWNGLANAILKFSENKKVSVIIFSLFTGSYPANDHVIASQIRDKLKGKVAVSCVGYRDEMTVDQLIKKFAECRVIIATRFHAAVMAFILNKPFGALCYNDKVRVFAEEAGVAPNLVLNIKEKSPEEWLEFLESLYGADSPRASKLNEFQNAAQQVFDREIGAI